MFLANEALEVFAVVVLNFQVIVEAPDPDDLAVNLHVLALDWPSILVCVEDMAEEDRG